MRLDDLNKMHSIRICLIGVCVAVFQIYQVSGINCGTVVVTDSLVQDGNRTVKGAWPFVVVLHLISDSEYLCGGTLISDKHVLTGNN